MTDTWGSVPFSALDDERLDGDPGPARAFFALVMVACDDHGLFEGDGPALARRLGCDQRWVEDGLVDLEQRGLVERYEAPGRRRKVGRVIGYHAFAGHPERKAYPSQRSASLYPDQSGQTIPGKDGRRRSATASQAPANHPASDAQVASKSSATGKKATGKPAATKPPGRRQTEEKRREEKRRDLRPTDEERGATSAPPLSSPSGSTNARAIESSEKGGPEPALEGAGRPPGVEESWPVYDLAELRAEDEQRESQRSRRPRALSPEEEANRRAALRAQLAAMVAEEAVAP